jgi:hypothetical protein
MSTAEESEADRSEDRLKRQKEKERGEEGAGAQDLAATDQVGQAVC